MRTVRSVRYCVRMNRGTKRTAIATAIAAALMGGTWLASSAQADDTACDEAITYADRMVEQHGKILGTQAAYGIALDLHRPDLVDKIRPKLQRMQSDYTDTLGAYQQAAANCP